MSLYRQSSIGIDSETPSERRKSIVSLTQSARPPIRLPDAGQDPDAYIPILSS
ncbi:hypothetical protein [Pseudoalteromonas aurantia]|uniref:hypothetical protein n=1 Tax=Pseudoalteromonas aurantia TaxID=43654 RepID=UPI001788234F|nr:hypothetical protein [Pseudoalteromonas aurantia]